MAEIKSPRTISQCWKRIDELATFSSNVANSGSENKMNYSQWTNGRRILKKSRIFFQTNSGQPIVCSIRGMSGWDEALLNRRRRCEQCGCTKGRCCKKKINESKWGFLPCQKWQFHRDDSYLWQMKEFVVINQFNEPKCVEVVLLASSLGGANTSGTSVNTFACNLGEESEQTSTEEAPINGFICCSFGWHSKMQSWELEY